MCALWPALLLHLCLCRCAVAPDASQDGGHHQLVMIKVHKPTASMRRRFCALAAEAAADVKGSVSVLLLALSDPAWHSLVACGSAAVVSSLSPQYTSLFPAVNLSAPASRVPGDKAAAFPVREYLLELAELFWFAQHRDTPFDYLWVVEQDVAWRGSLVELVASFATSQHDLLCHLPTRIVPRTGRWVWDSAHTGWANHSGSILRCYRHAFRVSRRLAALLIDDYLAQGHWAQDEWFAPTVCEQYAAGVLRAPPCSVAELADVCNGTCLGNPYVCCVGGPKDPPAPTEAWWTREEADRSAPPALFHPIKF